MMYVSFTKQMCVCLDFASGETDREFVKKYKTNQLTEANKINKKKNKQEKTKK